MKKRLLGLAILNCFINSSLIKSGAEPVKPKKEDIARLDLRNNEGRDLTIEDTKKPVGYNLPGRNNMATGDVDARKEIPD